MHPLLLPPQLIVRGLGDLHKLARSAETIAATVGRLETVDLDGAYASFETIAGAAARLPALEAALADIEQQALSQVKSIEERLAGVLELATRIEGGLPAIVEILDRISSLEERLGDALDLVGRLESDLASLGRIAPSVDILTEAAGRLADTVEPLQGTAERLGRITDRLPGASRLRT